MAIPHAYPGKPVDLRIREETPSETRTSALVKNDTFEAIRMVIPKGHEVCHDHQVEGMITVHCLVGRVAFTADGDSHELPTGHWLFLTGGVPHTITALEDALVLLTVMFR
jgi:quercetin dioxygenase-like cupin family protein